MKPLTKNFKSTLAKLFYTLMLLQIFTACKFAPEPAINIQLIPLFTENMVLQQKQENPIWGTAEPGGEVMVRINNQQKKAIVGDDGKWQVSLAPIPVGGAYELVISGEETQIIKNVLVGEVWICSGQSNMEMAVNVSNDAQNEIAKANYPNIRLITVERTTETTPQENFGSDGWKVCSSESIGDFSAVAYFFGRRLHKELNVPIGLIHSSWGGTKVEAWTSGKTLKQFPEFKAAVEYLEIDESTDEEKVLDIQKRLDEWPNKIEQILKDHGTFKHEFQNKNYKTNQWELMKLPTTWEQTGLEYDGVVWFSKTVQVPKSWKGQDLELSLGKINDYDITWFNGERVGRGTDVSEQRVYKIPASLVKVGENRITIQVLDVGNNGGIYGPSKKMKLSLNDQSVSLTGNWKYKIDPVQIDVSKLPIKPTSNSGANLPTGLYNGMISPLIPYGIKGAIWYQGEGNADRAYQYRALFKNLISDWRTDWKQGDFPFYFVQLANFMKVKAQPEDDEWAELREAQTMALELPNTGMAVIIDIGDAIDIHPKNKQDVGKRLALSALAQTYEKEIPFSGPMYESMKVEGNKIAIKFIHADGGLKVKGTKELKGFAIAGDDKKFVWATAEIKGDEIIVSSSKIKNPVAVRYAWASNPICNLYNGADLPASPFRTDTWEGKTFNKK